MATRYAGKYRRSPYPQATRTKSNQLLTVLNTGGTFWHPPKDKFSFLPGGRRLFLLGGDMSSHPLLTSHTVANQTNSSNLATE